MAKARILDVINNVVKVAHPDISTSEVTYLSAAVAAAGTSLTVESNQGFLTTTYVIIGKLGEEKTEIKLLGAPSGATTLAVAALSYAHPVDTPVTYIKYNQIKIYTCATETGTFVLDSTVNIDSDQAFTAFDDTDGTATLWYHVTYYNATDTAASAISDAVQAPGYKTGSVRKMIDTVRSLTNLETDEFIKDDELIDHLNNCQNNIENIRNWSFMQTYTTDSTVDSQQEYTLPTDFKTMKMLRITSGSTYYYPTIQDNSQWYLLNRTAVESTTPSYYRLWGGKFYLYPIPASNGTSDIRIDYYKTLTVLTDENSVTEVLNPMILVYYVCEQVELRRDDRSKANYFANKHKELIGDILRIDASRSEVMASPPRDLGYEDAKDPNFYTEIS